MNDEWTPVPNLFEGLQTAARRATMRLMDTARKPRDIHDDDGVFDDADALIALAQNSFERAAKEEVAKNDSLGIPTHGSAKGKLVVRHPPKGRPLAQH